MSKYTQMADTFLANAHAKIDIRLVGRAVNTDWDERDLRNLYDVTIITPRGSMPLRFWDSLYNTKQGIATPSAYDVLACLTKYDCGSFDTFCAEFGYNDDSLRAMRTYLACCDEYRNLCRIFTAEQMKELREIS